MNADLASTIGLLMGVISFVAGAVTWYRGSVEKRYAAERDFNHVRRNLEQLSGNLNDFAEEMDHRFDQTNGELIQVKSLLMALLAKAGDSTSGVLRER